MKAIRPWCAKAQYPGLKEFILGTVIIPSDADSFTIEKALVDHALTFIPPGFKITEPIAGALFFQEEE